MSGGADNSRRDDGRLQRDELFISYSRKDRRFLERFWTHLNPLETHYGLQRWDDSRINPGDNWLEEIERALGRAQVALLLVSPDFLASPFIGSKELPPLYKAAEKDGLKILWVPLSPCSWKRYRQISQYQAVIPVNPTLAEMGEVERDKAMVRISDQIHDVFDRIQKDRLEAQRSAELEALFQRKKEEQRIAEQEAKRQADEMVRLELFKAENEARAEANRWRIEAEQWQNEAQRLRTEVEEYRTEVQQCQAELGEWRIEVARLTKEIEELRQKNQFPIAAVHQYSIDSPVIASDELRLIQIPSTRGWLVKVGNQWRKKEESIIVRGYREELVDGIAISMLQIPGGEFNFGSPRKEARFSLDEGYQQRVRLRSFFMAQTPVTQEQWEVVAKWQEQDRFLNASPSISRVASDLLRG